MSKHDGVHYVRSLFIEKGNVVAKVAYINSGSEFIYRFKEDKRLKFSEIENVVLHIHRTKLRKEKIERIKNRIL